MQRYIIRLLLALFVIVVATSAAYFSIVLASYVNLRDGVR